MHTGHLPLTYALGIDRQYDKKRQYDDNGSFHADPSFSLSMIVFLSQSPTTLYSRQIAIDSIVWRSLLIRRGILLKSQRVGLRHNGITTFTFISR